MANKNESVKDEVSSKPEEETKTTSSNSTTIEKWSNNTNQKIEVFIAGKGLTFLPGDSKEMPEGSTIPPNSKLTKD